MKELCLALVTTALAVACSPIPPQEASETPAIAGTWQLVSGMQISGNDTTSTDYTQGQEMIKIYNDTHFAFLRHDLNHGADSAAIFVSGGGRYRLEESRYIEYLDYCNYREWEGHQFELNYRLSGDTLVTQSIEKLEELGVDQLNIETLVRVKQAAGIALPVTGR